jgi:hypothetical protein
MSKAKCSVLSAHVLSERRVKSEKRITVVHQLNRPLRNSLIMNWLPRMDSNHDKVIQSHLVHDGCAIVATFSGFRVASLPVCPTGPSSSQLIESKQLNFVLVI